VCDWWCANCGIVSYYIVVARVNNRQSLSVTMSIFGSVAALLTNARLYCRR
jgi:hypothetical protein